MEDKKIPKEIMEKLEWVQQDAIYGYYQIKDSVQVNPCEDCGKLLKSREFKLYKPEYLASKVRAINEDMPELYYLCKGCGYVWDPETGCYDLTPNALYQRINRKYKNRHK
jgi:hypothetical protein